MKTEISNALYDSLKLAFQEGKTDEGDYIQLERQSAFERFIEMGFPGSKHEEWRNSSIHSLTQRPFRADGGEEILDPSSVKRAEIDDLGAITLTTLNGKLQMDSLPKQVMKGVRILPFADAKKDPVFLEHFAKYADKTHNPFVALNTAISQDGFFIHIEQGVCLEQPIHLIHVGGADSAVFYQSRNLILVDAQAEAELVESFVSQNGDAETLGNSVTEVVVAEQAVLEHYYIQIAEKAQHYLNHTEIIQKKRSLYNHYNCNLPGAQFVRNNLNVRLHDENVESHLYGINLTAGHQIVDNHTEVDHMLPHCESYEWYKNIIQEESTVIFNGKIFVREDAQKTNAFQQNNNMLFGDQSTVFTKPQLEIFADDVKCSHGCTIGQFDEEALFYLQSRGIGRDQAQVLLVHAFAFDVTERFKNRVLKRYVDHLIEEGMILSQGDLLLQA